MPYVKHMFMLVLFLVVSNIYCDESPEIYGGGIPAPNPCLNCSICQYPCHPQPPPPSVYQSYGAPPPPPAAAGGKCPPTVVQCCEYPPPTPYTSVPYENHSSALIKSLSTMWSFVIFFLLIIVLVFHV